MKHPVLRFNLGLFKFFLVDVVIGITNYTGSERNYIHALAESLGMVSQETFAKREKKGAKQSTHLVCKLPEGQKYEAAIKWNLVSK